MRRIIIKLLGPSIRYASRKYFSKPRKYTYAELSGVVLPDVFPPHLTISTKMLLDFIKPIDLKNKSFLELGCGTGFISVFAAKKGAKVIASDINPKAIENTKLNAEKNGVQVSVIESDLFQNIDNQTFDYIIINPPYYPKKASSKAEEAWFCGENFEYFEKLFSQLKSYKSKTSKIYMILSQDCELEKIESIAAKSQLKFKTKLEKGKWGELNYIFQLKSV